MKTLAQLAAVQKQQHGKGRLPLTFLWTADRLPPAGCKDTTRRLWSPTRIEVFRRYAATGRIVPAWDNSPRVKEAQQIGWAQINSIHVEPLSALTPEEVAREGFPEMSVVEFLDRFFWKLQPDTEITVVRFTFEPLQP